MDWPRAKMIFFIIIFFCIAIGGRGGADNESLSDTLRAIDEFGALGHEGAGARANNCSDRLRTVGEFSFFGSLVRECKVSGVISEAAVAEE